MRQLCKAVYMRKTGITSNVHHFIIAIDVHELAPCIVPKLSLCLLKSNLSVLEKEKEHFLHPKELKRLATYTAPLRRKSYLLGRIAAKEAIATYWDNGLPYHVICIDNGLGGEPKVMNQNINISISHSNDYAVCLATSHLIKIGIDIENVDNIKERDLPNIYAEEIDLLKKIDIENKTLAYGLLWSAKESLVKYLETGFVLPFHLLTIAHIGIKNGCIIAEFTNFPTFQVILFYTHTLVMAICISKKVLIKEPIDFLYKL